MFSTDLWVRYRIAEEMYRSLPLWNNVPERDRRDLYEDLLVQLAKREKENARNTRKSNMRKLTVVLHDLDSLTHKTLWKEAQELLIEQPAFIDDKDLQNMDKEDALVCFEQVIIFKSRAENLEGNFFRSFYAYNIIIKIWLLWRRF